MDTLLILTLRFPLRIGYFGTSRHSFIVDIEKMKKYWDLPESEIILYAKKINANYQKDEVKIFRNRVSKVELAIKYNEMIKSGECSNYADIARKLYVSRAWVTKVMKYLPINKA